MISTLKFLNLLYQKADSFIYLWTLQDKKTYWFSCNEIEKMKEKAFELNKAKDIYFGVGGVEKKLLGHKRASAVEINMLPGFWVDIDIKGEAHKAGNLPNNLEEALSLLPPRFSPTLIVDSGYGIHVYWLFEKPWIFKSEEDRKNASFLIQSLQKKIKDTALEKGFKVDTTSDLARIMRLPGTINYKIPNNPKTSKVIKFEENYYSYDKFSTPISIPKTTSMASFNPKPFDGLAELMFNNCAFLRHCQLNAKEISYDEWLACLTNIVRAKDGVKAVHEFSALDDRRYDFVATDKKIKEALKMNPQNCEYIKGVIGFSGCPLGGCKIKAPCGWSLSKIAKAKALVRKINMPNPSDVFQEEIIKALAVLKKEEPLEYQEFKKRCKGQVNLRDLEQSIKKSQLHLVEAGEKLGDRRISDVIENIPCDLILPPNFNLDSMGIKHVKETAEGNLVSYKATGDIVLISKRLCNIDTNIEKVEICFQYLNTWKTINIERSTVMNSRQIIKLADFGLSVSSESAKYLVKYFDALMDYNKDNIPIVSTVSKLGWRGQKEFILPQFEEKYQIDVEDFGSRQTLEGFNIAGDRNKWLSLMNYLRQKPIARFILASSFAPPLLKILGQRNFIIHNWGNTQDGKTATLWASISVWGNPEALISSFDSTATAIERKANLYCDLPLAINEREVLNKFKKDDLSPLLYMLGEGKGRGRGDKRGLQGTVSWRTVVLSTGENTLLNNESLGGAITRVLEIYGGAFENDRDFARKLYHELPHNHGYAGRDFLKILIDYDKDFIINVYREFQKIFRENFSDKLDSHIDAVSCVATADYLTSYWIFKQSFDEAYKGAYATAKYILDSLITAMEASESKRAWEEFNDFLATNSERFSAHCTGERYGIKEGPYLYVIRKVINDFLKTRDQNPRKILKDWADEGKIEVFNEDGKARYDKQKKFGGSNPRVVKIIKI